MSDQTQAALDEAFHWDNVSRLVISDDGGVVGFKSTGFKPNSWYHVWLATDVNSPKRCGAFRTDAEGRIVTFKVTSGEIPYPEPKP